MQTSQVRRLGSIVNAPRQGEKHWFIVNGWDVCAHTILLRIGRGGATPSELFQGTLLEEIGPTALLSGQEPREDNWR